MADGFEDIFLELLLCFGPLTGDQFNSAEIRLALHAFLMERYEITNDRVSGRMIDRYERWLREQRR